MRYIAFDASLAGCKFDLAMEVTHVAAILCLLLAAAADYNATLRRDIEPCYNITKASDFACKPREFVDLQMNVAFQRWHVDSVNSTRSYYVRALSMVIPMIENVFTLFCLTKKPIKPLFPEDSVFYGEKNGRFFGQTR